MALFKAKWEDRGGGRKGEEGGERSGRERTQGTLTGPHDIKCPLIILN